MNQSRKEIDPVLLSVCLLFTNTTIRSDLKKLSIIPVCRQAGIIHYHFPLHFLNNICFTLVYQLLCMRTLHKGQFLGNIEHWRQDEGLTISVTSYQSRDREADLLHYHDHPNLYFILDGGSVEKRRASEAEHTAGSLLFYHAGEVHQNIRKGFNARSINMEVDRSFLQAAGIAEAGLERATLESPDAKLLVLSMYRELMAADPFSGISMQLLMLDLLHRSGNTKQYTSWPAWVKNVHGLLNDRWNETLSLEELAVAAGVNPITISKHFPLYFSCTLGEYMRKLKIDKALTLVKATSLPLAAIAYECGFADQSHFIRLFKKHTGFLPARFRKL
jgi:AraC family transcriptional regulator